MKGDNKHSKYPRVKPVEIKRDSSVNELIEEFKQSGVFGPGRIAEAVDIYSTMINEKATIFLGIAGALIPGGMRRILVDMIRNKMINVIVSTGANITHDIIEAVGGKHIKEVPFKSDKELRERSIDRIYDAFVDDESFMKLEDKIRPIFEDIWKTRKDENEVLAISTQEIIKLIGERITDENSIVRAAFEENIPIFVPAFCDSVLGLHLWLFSQMHKVLIDEMEDLGEIQKIAWDADKAGAFFLGGGVPKNYIFQSRLMSPKTFDYAIQITMDRVETGGLSGASLDEAISWGKVRSESKMVTVVADVTIALPLIFGGTLSRIKSR